MSHESEIVLAFLKVNWEACHRDYLDNLVPLAAEVIRGGGRDVVSFPDVQAGLRERFGLGIPFNPFVGVLNIARSAGLLKRDRGHLSYP